MADDPADAVLFQFKATTEARLSTVEDKLAETERTQTELQRDLLGLRNDVARTQRVVLEIQSEMRSTLKQVLAKLGGPRVE